MNRLFTRIRHDRRGLAAVETGMISAFVLLPLLGGTLGFGQGLAMQTKLDRALHAGLMKAWGTAGALTQANVSTSITPAVQDGYGATPAPTVTAALAYYCIATTGTRSDAGSTTVPTCTAPQINATYITITASTTFSPLVAMPITGWNQAGGTRGAVTISSTATVRIQ